jgi:AraC-like DNA-binding protein
MSARPGRTHDGTDFSEVRAFLDRHYARTITVSQLARQTGLSRAHFIRAFQAASGVTPHQYLRARRIERAKELLATTSLPVTDICEAVGFQSLGSFSTLFRRLTRETPAGWRARRRQHPPLIPGCFIRMFRVG